MQQLSDYEKLCLKRSLSYAVRSINGDKQKYQQAISNIPANQRTDILILKDFIDEIANTVTELTFTYSSDQLEKVKSYYFECVSEFLFTVFVERKFDLKRVALILGFTSLTFPASVIRILPRVLENAKLTATPALKESSAIIELMINLIRARDKVPQVRQTLEEIRTSSVEFILNQLDKNNKTIVNLSEDILVMLIARRLYNAMYWYIYEKQ